MPFLLWSLNSCSILGVLHTDSDCSSHRFEILSGSVIGEDVTVAEVEPAGILSGFVVWEDVTVADVEPDGDIIGFAD